MLSMLHIENIAVIEAADLTFASGFQVLTGETGAGKSIVIDAISAILGGRTSRDIIRTGADRAFVRAVFEGVPALSWFGENGVPYDGEELLIQRELTLDGRNNCRVNGQAVSVGMLHTLGLQLIQIHGQHDSQQLFDEENHLRYLDLFAGNDAQLETYRQSYERVTALRQKLSALEMDEGEKLRRSEMLHHQITEIERAELKPGEEDALEDRRRLLQNAEKYTDGLMTALRCLYGDDTADGAEAMLSQALRSLRKIAAYDSKIAALCSGMETLCSMARDTSEALIDLKDAISYSPEELDELEGRLDVLHRLRRKYGGGCEEILQFCEDARRELASIENADAQRETLTKELSAAEKTAQAAAHSLHETRTTAAKALEERIRRELSELMMPKVQFVCSFSDIPLSPTGTDGVAFLMSANVGEALKPMSKVASGGELARIMLAMKNVLSERDAVGTLIFDEVDAGVSGRAAQSVAVKLKGVARNRQVLCVTHLPQIAAMADAHFLIAKEEREGRTYTSVTPLSREGRIDELARLIGGEVITQTTRLSAAEMLPGGVSCDFAQN